MGTLDCILRAADGEQQALLRTLPPSALQLVTVGGAETLFTAVGAGVPRGQFYAKSWLVKTPGGALLTVWHLSSSGVGAAVSWAEFLTSRTLGGRRCLM